jgi:uncharacterized FlaG/YvyC family protein
MENLEPLSPNIDLKNAKLDGSASTKIKAEVASKTESKNTVSLRATKSPAMDKKVMDTSDLRSTINKKLRDVASDSRISAKKRNEANLETRKRVEEVVAHLNSEIVQRNRQIKFRVDAVTEQTIVEVINKHNGKIVAQIPAQRLIDLSRNMDALKGMLFDDTM